MSRRVSRRAFRRARFVTSLVAMVAVVAGVTQAIAFVEAPHAAKAAAAAASGTGGQFVPVQGRVLDTRSAYQVGPYNTPMTAGVWRTVTVAGMTMSDGSQLPSAISAVAVNFTVIGPAGAGYLNADKDGPSPNAQFAYMRYLAGDDQSNSGTLAVADDGKIQVKSSQNTNLLIDVEGYYTADDTVAPGGYVPVTPKRIVDTGSGLGLPKGNLAAGSTTTIQVSGSASGVPAGASAAMLNITTFGDHSTKSHYYVPYPADEAKPGKVSMSFPIGDTDASESQVGLSTTTATGAPVGAFKLYFSQPENYTVGIQVDVVGYFTAGVSTGAFTPAAARVYATGSYDQQSPARATLASQETRTVQVAGINGVPQAGSGISAVALHLSVYDHGTNGGYTEVWANGKPRPSPYSSVNLARNGLIGNMVTSQLGDNGAVSIFNQSKDTLDILVDVEGWYTGVGSAITNGQTQTQQSLTLQADPTVGGSWVSYQYRDGTDGAFTTVPVANVKDGSGAKPSSWPVQKNGGSFTAYTWNVRDTLAALPANSGTAPDSLIQVQACYGTSSTDSVPVCNMPSNIQFSQTDGGDATTDIGPGSVSEPSGDLTISETDAGAATSLGSLSVGRSLSTLNPAPASSGADGVFGPGWTADFPAASGGAADLSVTDNAAKHYLTFTGSDGSVSTYLDPQAATAYPMTFEASGDHAGDDTMVTKLDASTVTMTETDGTTTTWKKAGSPAVWRADSVTTSAANSTTSYTYSTGGNTNGLVTRIQAPAPAGIDCSINPDTTAGCRSLILNYTSTTPARLANIMLSIPQTSTANTVAVAGYSYDSSGRLVAAWDPRITANNKPSLVTAYGYFDDNRIKTVTPPGLATWTLAYDGDGRLKTASRPDPSGQTAVSTVVYGVPVATAEGGPVDLTAPATAKWGQTDDPPIIGTAVFGPNRTPSGNTPSTVGTSDWPYASIDFQDVNGRTVDSANYGAGAWQIGATGYDSNGNETWSLTPGNLKQALMTTADTDSYVASKSGSADRAGLLSSTSVYGNPLNPGQLTDTYGPTHPIVLDDGSSIHGRSHVATTYDEGAPNNDVNPTTNQAYGLPTTTTASAYRVDGTAGDTAGTDSRTTHTGYEPIQAGDPSGWRIGQATSSTQVMAGGPSDLVTKIRYNADGRVVEKRLPNDDGTGSRTTLSTYYTYAPGSSGPCIDRTRVGLLCTTAPAGQPSSGAPLPVVSYSYDQYGNQTAKTETYGSGSSQVLRTNTTTYDLGERVSTTSVAVTPASAGGAALPTATTTYAADTGLPTVVSTTTGSTTNSLTTSYDNLGRKIKYTDATGNVSSTNYDLSGKVSTANDGKRTTAYTTDSSSEHRGLVTSEDIGVSAAPSTFAASYDAAGNMTSEIYPNGLIATRRYDNAGDLFSLTYAKGGSTWLAFTQDVNALGHIARQASTKSSQVFGYDGADRLTSVRDTVQGSCTTRAYKFDDHSNRTELATSPAASGGACSPANPAKTSYSYDGADRLTSDTPGGSYSYDTLGRATQVPSTDAQGTGSHSTITGNAALTYYSNDMVNTQTQGGTADSFTLDPNQNRISSQVDGTVSTVNHYDSDGDTPAWTASGSTWTEYASDLSGNLAASADQANVVTLRLVNPHGDVVATAPDTTNASAPSSTFETTEYGLPRDAASAPSTYGWLGGKQRSSNGLAGLIAMGVRQYNPSTGQFLSGDSVPGGNLNSYTYPVDPVNQSDTTGKFRYSCGNVTCTFLIGYGDTKRLLRATLYISGGASIVIAVLGLIFGTVTGGLAGILAGAIAIHIAYIKSKFDQHRLVKFKGILLPKFPFPIDWQPRSYKPSRHWAWRL